MNYKGKVRSKAAVGRERKRERYQVAINLTILDNVNRILYISNVIGGHF